MTAPRWSLPEQLHSYVRGRGVTVMLEIFAHMKQAVSGGDSLDYRQVITYQL